MPKLTLASRLRTAREKLELASIYLEDGAPHTAADRVQMVLRELPQLEADIRAAAAARDVVFPATPAEGEA